MLRNPHLMRWLARGAAIAVTLFLSLFALDAFDEGTDVAGRVRDGLMHLLPALTCLLLLVVAWRRPFIGAAAFALLAAVYALWAWGRPDWVAAISGPLLVVAALYAVDGRLRPRA